MGKIEPVNYGCYDLFNLYELNVTNAHFKNGCFDIDKGRWNVVFFNNNLMTMRTDCYDYTGEYSRIPRYKNKVYNPNYLKNFCLLVNDQSPLVVRENVWPICNSYIIKSSNFEILTDHIDNPICKEIYSCLINLRNDMFLENEWPVDQFGIYYVHNKHFKHYTRAFKIENERHRRLYKKPYKKNQNNFNNLSFYENDEYVVEKQIEIQRSHFTQEFVYKGFNRKTKYGKPKEKYRMVPYDDEGFEKYTCWWGVPSPVSIYKY